MTSPVMSTEERLRAAARAAADTVAPGSAPPLRLPDDPAASPQRGSWPGRRHWVRALTPLAAAAAVAAAVIASLTLTRGVPAPRGGGQSPARPVALHGVPRYYVTLTSTAMPSQAVIGDTATGAVVTTVKPPRPYRTFDFVSGAAGDRTFVLAAQRWWPIASGAAGPRRQRIATTPLPSRTSGCGSTRPPGRPGSPGCRVCPGWGPTRWRGSGCPRTAPGWPWPCAR